MEFLINQMTGGCGGVGHGVGGQWELLEFCVFFLFFLVSFFITSPLFHRVVGDSIRIGSQDECGIHHKKFSE